jgi:hypothetical protein
VIDAATYFLHHYYKFFESVNFIFCRKDNQLQQKKVKRHKYSYFHIKKHACFFFCTVAVYPFFVTSLLPDKERQNNAV